MPHTIHVIEFDQFSEVTPYRLQRQPVAFAELLQAVEAHPEQFGPFRPPRVLDVPDDFRPEWATTLVREGADGRAEVWKVRWDSSG